ncbi:unnamed protein product [Pelagomonas calceolata]|uniref:MYND-type domain-containing protein n=1 Tax=Pelagomonas calceolata TaxID=35677 RepID=A0A8J2SFN6_9STRA|nr:unnamed protein product [Pelagomonas calceolata]
MILTTCAACAAPLALDAPRCVRCKVRYCDSTCQHDHWRRGHKQMCKKIHRGGNAEQYHADKKYKEAVAAAVEKCAADTKGQTCYICTQALHWKTKEGLVRGCACRGTSGFAHVSCLAEQAKILVAEGEENNLGLKAKEARWERWHTCSLCEQRYHGVVLCALGWACWKTYVEREKTDCHRFHAMAILGSGLRAAFTLGSPQKEKEKFSKEALRVFEAQLSELQTLHKKAKVELQLNTMMNIAACYADLRWHEKSLSMKREMYYKAEAFNYPFEGRLQIAINLANSLIVLGHHAEAKSFLRQTIDMAIGVLGPTAKLNHVRVLTLRAILGNVCFRSAASREDVAEAERIIADVLKNERRVLGPAHPETLSTQRDLEKVRAVLRA